MGLAAGFAARASVALSMTFSSGLTPAPSLPDRDGACHYPVAEKGCGMPVIGNLLADLSPKGAEEELTQLLRVPAVRVERIVSHGHASPPGFWYDENQAEWVLLLQGARSRIRARGRTHTARTGRSCQHPGARTPSRRMDRSGPPYDLARRALS